MSSQSEKSSSLLTFPFPFTPYNVQLQLMTSIYDTIERGGVGIFESPTGTGKSLSLICGILHWITEREYASECEQIEKQQKIKEEEEAATTSSELDWVRAHGKKLRQQSQVVKQKITLTIEERLHKIRAQNLKKKAKCRRIAQAAAFSLDSDSDTMDGSDDEFLIEEYNEFNGNGKASASSSSSSSSKRERYDHELDQEEEENVLLFETAKDVLDEEIQILYCSRTHSQLAQFVNEIKKTTFSHVRVVSLGSRKSLCIHDTVRALRTDTKMNERCLEMADSRRKATQKKKKKEKKKLKQQQQQQQQQQHQVHQQQNNKTTSLSNPIKRQRTTSTQRGNQIHGCPFRGSSDGVDSRGHRFSSSILATIHDIEELREEGQKVGVCPYYGTRETLPLAKVITMPYSMLLHKKTRESVGLRLKNNIVVFDEGHNVIDAIANIHSSRLTFNQLQISFGQLKEYEERYRTRLSLSNLKYIKQLLLIHTSIVKYLHNQQRLKMSTTTSSNSSTTSSTNSSTTSSTTSSSTSFSSVKSSSSSSFSSVQSSSSVVHTINDFLFEVGIEDINLYKISEYLDASKICQKLQGFVKYQNQIQNPETNTTTTNSKNSKNVEPSNTKNSRISPLSIVQQFLMCCVNTEADGRIVVEFEPITSTSTQSSFSSTNQSTNQSSSTFSIALKYLVLNPDVYFKKIVSEAKSVILAGGTMQPMSRITTQLFPRMNQSITRFSCGHVVPKENVITITMPKGPTNMTYNFSFTHRSNPKQIDELGRSMLNMCNIVPHGMVVFLPSYNYEAVVMQRWKQTGLLRSLNVKKEIFREERGSGTSVAERTLRNYSIAAKSKKGGLLFCVVGGKMSEGINFSDDLARLVVVVGLPFANPRDPVLKEKMNYLNRKAASRLSSLSGTTASSGFSSSASSANSASSASSSSSSSSFRNKNNMKTKTTTTATPVISTAAGQNYYEDICMNSVNQSIGRAIRHQNDYAAIVLIDHRYTTSRIHSKLPGWIRESLNVTSSFGESFGKLARFYKQHRVRLQNNQ